MCAFALAGCGGSRGAHSYLLRYGNGESFIQWQQHGQHVHGTISTTQSSATSPYPVRLLQQSLTLTGTVSGSNVFLHLSNGMKWNGTLHSYGLLLRAESTSGPPQSARYRRASVADYDAAVAQTKARVRQQKENG